MKSTRRVPSFEQLEQKRLLAADVCEQDLVDVPPMLEPAVLAAALNAADSHDCRTNEAMIAESSASIVQSRTEVNSQDSDDDDDETETEDESEEQEETEEEDDSDDDSDDDEDDEDDEDDDDDDSEDEVDDDTDDDETVQTANLTGTGTGTAEFETETEDSTTERELTIEVSGTTPGTHAVKIGSTTVGNIVVGSDGSGTLKLSSDPDEDESLLPESITSVQGQTVMVGTVLMGTFPASAPATATDSAESQDFGNSLLLAASDASSNGPSTEVASRSEVAAQSASFDASAIDLLLALLGNDDPDEPESTEFVGRSDQRDAAPEAVDMAFKTEDDESEQPVESTDRS
jgi:hypothetical protein